MYLNTGPATYSQRRYLRGRQDTALRGRSQSGQGEQRKVPERSGAPTGGNTQSSQGEQRQVTERSGYGRGAPTGRYTQDGRGAPTGGYTQNLSKGYGEDTYQGGRHDNDVSQDVMGRRHDLGIPRVYREAAQIIPMGYNPGKLRNTQSTTRDYSQERLKEGDEQFVGHIQHGKETNWGQREDSFKHTVLARERRIEPNRGQEDRERMKAVSRMSEGRGEVFEVERTKASDSVINELRSLSRNSSQVKSMNSSLNTRTKGSASRIRPDTSSVRTIGPQTYSVRTGSRSSSLHSRHRRVKRKPLNQTDVKIAKGLLGFFNVLFWLSGLCLFGLGVVELLDTERSSLRHLLQVRLQTNLPAAPVLHFLHIGLLVMGGVVLVTGCLGCWAALKGNRIVTVLYILLLLLVLCGEMSIAALAVVIRSLLSTELRQELVAKLHDNYNMPRQQIFTRAIDRAQTKFLCCGISSQFDYSQSAWRRHRLGGSSLLLPLTCCRLANEGQDSAFLDPQPHDVSTCQDTGMINTRERNQQGCLGDLVQWGGTECLVLVAAGMGGCLLQMVGLVIAWYSHKQFRRRDRIK